MLTGFCWFFVFFSAFLFVFLLFFEVVTLLNSVFVGLPVFVSESDKNQEIDQGDAACRSSFKEAKRRPTLVQCCIWMIPRLFYGFSMGFLSLLRVVYEFSRVFYGFSKALRCLWEV